ncbi:D-alanyl-D-alanine carboxypeptidase [Mesorhizobium sp. SP-1A]|uniref:D-alanyl-D-alanine carboxypeptidase n=1 Tax=Mesorhizobium sp. SP-1A TaxID=3077840 RepID=UPI0028F6C9CA|nr:D-alanyl-D-alanine carboxypeptidase [Mesorhizobium sp. SP-1A]
MRQALSGIVSKSGSFFKAAMIVALAVTFAVADVSASMAAQYAAIVIDARTGKVLYSKDANGRRYPASLTKMMTLYLTFEAMTKGRINKTTPVVFSAHAAAQAPTKLGVRAGSAVTVETAILSMVTKSANDSSTALAELLGGTESNFARLMTAKARSLGMSGTVFRNANGLPDPGQFTTAHDMAVLGIALREHFPQYYGYFSTRSFMFGRTRINGHNRLLGRIKGVDGIKTGYTRMSGFNLVSSVADGNRRLVAVVMGGTSGASRDNQMAKLIDAYLPQASTRGNGPLVGRADNGSAAVALSKTLLPKTDVPTPDGRPAEDEEVASAEDSMPVVPAARPAVKVAAMTPAPAPTPQAAPQPEAPAMAAYAEQPKVDPVATASVSSSDTPSGWVVQVASAPTQAGAQAILDQTVEQARAALASATGFTSSYQKGSVTYYRARFGGFGSKTAAWRACDALKKKKIQCYAVQQ